MTGVNGLQFRNFHKFNASSRMKCLLLSIKNLSGMKKNSFFLVLVAVVLIWSCNGGPAAEAPAEVKITHTELSGDVEKTVAKMAIGGMMCAHSCGGKIQQELQAIKGVNTTDVDYADNRETNVVTVEFDPKLVSEKELIAKVQSIADGRYPISSVEIVSFKPSATSSTGTSNSDDAGVTLHFSQFNKLLNLWQLVNGLIH
jgi:copper chaperone CopZ